MQKWQSFSMRINSNMVNYFERKMRIKQLTLHDDYVTNGYFDGISTMCITNKIDRANGRIL